MAERRPRVSLDGTIKNGFSEDMRKLIESHGIDPEKCVVIRNDMRNMLVKFNKTYYLLYKEEGE